MQVTLKGITFNIGPSRSGKSLPPDFDPGLGTVLPGKIMRHKEKESRIDSI